MGFDVPERVDSTNAGGATLLCPLHGRQVQESLRVGLAKFVWLHLDSCIAAAYQPLQKSPFLGAHASVAVQDIVNHFGDDFVFFLKTDPSLGGMEADDSMTHPLSLDMPWAERSLLLEAIDNLLLIPALQRGARVAYLLVFGGRSWEAEIEKVADKLAQLRMVP